MSLAPPYPRAFPVLMLSISGAVPAFGCGPGSLGKAVEPNAPTAAQAIDGKAACTSAKQADQPLVVDMPPELRADLEIAMRDKIAVVSYDCKSLKVLRGCHVDGDYSFFGTTLQEKTVQLKNADEISVNLPIAGAGLVAKLGGGMKSGSTLDLALIMVGAKRTTWSQVEVSDLKGSCEGATHFVFGAFIGAFAMHQGTEGKAATTATVFGSGSDASSSSTSAFSNKVGDPDACSKADPMAKEAPSKCGVPIRLELLPVGVKSSHGSEEAPHPAAKLISSECPTGYVLTEGKCAKAGSASAHQCDGKDPIECSKQCDLGDGASCGRVGDLYRAGEGGIAKDAAKGFGYEKKGCDLKDPTACYWQAWMMTHGAGVAKDYDGGVALLKDSCMMGSAVACHDAAISFINHQPASWPNAFPFFAHGCDGGEQRSCNAVARCYSLGGGACGSVKRDEPRAVALWRRACDGRVGESCRFLGSSLETGAGTAKDVVAASVNYRKSCDLEDRKGCFGLAKLYEKGDPAFKADRKEAVAYFERAQPDGDAAVYYGNLLVEGKAVPADKAKGVKLLRGECTHEKKINAKKLAACDSLQRIGEKE